MAKKALSSVLKASIKPRGGNIVSYALRFTYMGDQIHAHDICNARMNWVYGTPNKSQCTDIVQDVAWISKKSDVNMTHFKAYVKWLLNASPWKDCFLTKDLSSAFRYGVKFNVDKSISQIAAAGIVLREGTEHSWRLKLFNKLMKDGFSGDVAFLVSYAVKGDGVYSFQGFGGSHRVLSPTMHWGKLKEFFNKPYAECEEKPMRTSKDKSYSIFANIAKDTASNNAINIVIQKALNKGDIIETRWGVADKEFTYDDVKVLAQFVSDELK
jgi:hypothetical protein